MAEWQLLAGVQAMHSWLASMHLTEANQRPHVVDLYQVQCSCPAIIAPIDRDLVVLEDKQNGLAYLSLLLQLFPSFQTFLFDLSS